MSRLSGAIRSETKATPPAACWRGRGCNPWTQYLIPQAKRNRCCVPRILYERSIGRTKARGGSRLLYRRFRAFGFYGGYSFKTWLLLQAGVSALSLLEGGGVKNSDCRNPFKNQIAFGDGLGTVSPDFRDF